MDQVLRPLLCGKAVHSKKKRIVQLLGWNEEEMRKKMRKKKRKQNRRNQRYKSPEKLITTLPFFFNTTQWRCLLLILGWPIIDIVLPVVPRMRARQLPHRKVLNWKVGQLLPETRSSHLSIKWWFMQIPSICGDRFNCADDRDEMTNGVDRMW